MPDDSNEVATLAGGCFWCLEAVFEQVHGVMSVVSGYTGGTLPDPAYEAVCGGGTGHAEAVRISFDPGQVGFQELLRIFFGIHDPTTLNRQGNDVGTQYRSAIFYHSEHQRQEAQAMINVLSEQLAPASVVTELLPATVFYPAEPYHQQYYARHPGQGYCQFVIRPKLEKLHQRFRGNLKQTDQR